MPNTTNFQPVTADLLAVSYLDTSCIEDYDSAVDQLASDINTYVKEAAWLDSNNDFFDSLHETHMQKINRVASSIYAATGRAAHIVCHALLAR